MTTSCVSFSAVGKHFGGNWVFRDVTFSCPSGETTAIVGESGSGKTTLLQLVNGVLRPNEGRVEVLGESVPAEGIEAFRRRIGYAVQGAGLFPHMTVRQNVDLLARLERWPRDAIESASPNCWGRWVSTHRLPTGIRINSPVVSSSASDCAGRSC